MKAKIIIKNQDNQEIFNGKPLQLPINKQAIIDKSIELYGDPDPCILHQSYAIQKLVEKVFEILPEPPLNELSLSAYYKKLDFINIDNLDQYFITIEVKKKK
jgi:hypothetical protein